MKLKIQLRKRLNLENMRLALVMFCVVSYALLEHASVSVSLFSLVKNPLLYMGGLCLLPQLPGLLKYWKKKRYFYTFVLLILMCLALAVSFYANRHTNIGVNPMRNTLRLMAYLVEMFLLMVWLAETGKSDYLLNFLFHYVLVLTVLTDVLMFSGLLRRWTGNQDAYLVGTKFTVSYFHMNLLTLWFVRNKRQLSYGDRKAKRVILLGTPVVVAVAIYMDCITGILGCLILLALFLLLNTQVQRKLIRLNSPVLLSILLVASLVFPVVADWFTSLPITAYLLKNVFGRDATLTGRLDIFALFNREMEGRWLWGFGFGNGNAAAVHLFGYANAQNALLHWILQVGVPVTVLLVLLLLTIFRPLSKVRDQMRCMPFVLLIYVYVIIGFIEITFSMNFLLWMGIIFMLINERPQEETVRPMRNGVR